MSRRSWTRPGRSVRGRSIPATASCRETPPSPKQSLRPAWCLSGLAPLRSARWATRRRPAWPRSAPAWQPCRAEPARGTGSRRGSAIAGDIGSPVLIKASAGGGGRGIHIAGDASELRQELGRAQAQAKAAFGDAAVYLERFIRQARHIEVQILGDGKRVVHCFERECSLQRRRKKIGEEARCAAIDAATRQALCDSALALARAVDYSGAGTLEYLYDEDTRAFFFIEMNTGIQVEHPVTELVTGVDLVKEMLRTALGEPLRLQQSDIALRGAAIEVRINAENAARNFMPCPGTLSSLHVPGGPGVRFDSMLFPGCRVGPFYDSLLAKLSVHDENRPAALARLERALDELGTEGLTTTQGLHQKLVRDPQVRAGQLHTGFLEAWLAAHPL